jgi:hypothetical protein
MNILWVLWKSEDEIEYPDLLCTLKPKPAQMRFLLCLLHALTRERLDFGYEGEGDGYDMPTCLNPLILYMT